jgi:hypothetical protein
LNAGELLVEDVLVDSIENPAAPNSRRLLALMSARQRKDGRGEDQHADEMK